jgi:glycosyltransferase involved in cell wall biosynthesis
MTSPISVAMAVYNGREFLVEQVESVLSQLEPGDELVIVDDASTDGSAALLSGLESPYIRLFVNDSNVGVMKTFERALRLARHTIIFLCDQDDIWLPGKRSAYVEAFARNPATRIVISDAELVDGKGEILSSSYMTTGRGGFDGSVLGTLWRNRYLGCAMAVRDTLLPVALPIPSRAPMHDMWLGVLGKISGDVVYLPKPYQRYRRHGRNASPMGSNSWIRMLSWRLTLAGAVLLRMTAVLLGLHSSKVAARVVE